MKAKEIPGLDYGASAVDGVRQILRSRLEEMRAFRAAALDWSDPEGVHDMRVASRRLRSAISDFSPYLRKRKLRRSNDDLKGIADALGAVRDQDVAIMALDELAAKAPPEVSAGIEQFTSERRLKREIARAELGEAITDDALAKLEDEFNDALERGLKVSRRRRDGHSKFAEQVSCRRAGRDIIAARLEKLQDLSASLYQPLRAKPLHRMRIAAKRLRYAIELFAPCWSEPLAPFAKEIAKLQTSLGELHDCDVWMAELEAALRRGERESEGAERRKRSAAFWLLDYFAKERTHHFRDALALWHEWETSGFHSRLADTLDDKLPAAGVEDVAISHVKPT